MVNLRKSIKDKHSLCLCYSYLLVNDFPLISSSDIFSINRRTMILKIIGSHDVKHIMRLLITTITSVLNVSTNIITSIRGRPLRLAVIVVMSALTFITVIIRYISVFALIFSTTYRKAKFRKKYLFIQTNSFITFTCPKPILLVPGYGQVG